MNLGEVPLLGMLRERMSWLNARQNILSQNVANADSPGYLAQDLKPVDFEQMMRDQKSSADSGLIVTDPHHIAISSSSPTSYVGIDTPDTEATTTGNTVSLEQEMIKVADTQAQYQAATNIYSKALSMMRTAIGNP